MLVCLPTIVFKHIRSSLSRAEYGESLSSRKNVPLPISVVHAKPSRSNTQAPALPPIVTADDTDPNGNRHVSWQSQSSANTTSTISPGGPLFDQALFDAFPSVPQDVPSPGPGTTAFPLVTTLPPRTRKHSAHKLG